LWQISWPRRKRHSENKAKREFEHHDSESGQCASRAVRATGDKEQAEMSKYTTLWEYIQKDGRPSFKLTFAEIEEIAQIPIDHSFLNFKKELVDYGYRVGKISMKEKHVTFNKEGVETR
jgi:hypothetical protein